MIELPEHRMPRMSSVVLCPGETNANDHDSEFLIFLEVLYASHLPLDIPQ